MTLQFNFTPYHFYHHGCNSSSKASAPSGETSNFPLEYSEFVAPVPVSEDKLWDSESWRGHSPDTDRQIVLVEIFSPIAFFLMFMLMTCGLLSVRNAYGTNREEKQKAQRGDAKLLI